MLGVGERADTIARDSVYIRNWLQGMNPVDIGSFVADSTLARSVDMEKKVRAKNFGPQGLGPGALELGSRDQTS